MRGRCCTACNVFQCCSLVWKGMCCCALSIYACAHGGSYCVQVHTWLRRRGCLLQAVLCWPAFRVSAAPPSLSFCLECLRLRVERCFDEDVVFCFPAWACVACVGVWLSVGFSSTVCVSFVGFQSTLVCVVRGLQCLQWCVQSNWAARQCAAYCAAFQPPQCCLLPCCVPSKGCRAGSQLNLGAFI